MQKKLIALAVAAALTTPALAMADVTVYGKAFLDVESVNNDQAGTLPAARLLKSNATRVATNASRLGVKGSEDLGDNLKAIFQYEVQMDANGVGGNGLGNGTRNSGIGMEGDFGKVIVGRWDSPYKVVHNSVELFDNATVFSATNVVGRSANGKNYNNRQSSMIQYWTPKMGGFQAALMYAPDAAPTVIAAAAAAGKTILALSGTYDQDGIYAGLGYESRTDQSFVNTTDSAMRLTGKYTFGPAWIGATVESVKTNTAPAVSYTQNIYELVGQYNIDANFIGLSYAKAGKSNVANTGASQVSLKLGHNFSKKVEGFIAYTQLKNDAVTVAGTGGTYALSAGTPYGIALGSTQSAFGAGMSMSF